jgi:hypothetical protein
MCVETISAVNSARRVEIAPRDARSLHVTVGTAIQAVSGRIWLTQEGDSRDYSIPAGVTFCVDRGGRAVLSAIDGASVVIVRQDNERPRCVPGSITIHSMLQLDREARASQSAYFAALFRRMLDKFRRTRPKQTAARASGMQRA